MDELCEHHAGRVGFLSAQVGAHGFVQSGIAVTEPPEKLRARRAGDGMDLDAVVKHAGEHSQRVRQRQRRAGRKACDCIAIELDSVGAAVAGADHQIEQGCVTRGECRIPFHATEIQTCQQW